MSFGRMLWEYRYSVKTTQHSGVSDLGPISFLMYNPESGNGNGKGNEALLTLGQRVRRRYLPHEVA
jgi:hypothetical protein